MDIKFIEHGNGNELIRFEVTSVLEQTRNRQEDIKFIYVFEKLSETEWYVYVHRMEATLNTIIKMELPDRPVQEIAKRGLYSLLSCVIGLKEILAHLNVSLVEELERK